MKGGGRRAARYPVARFRLSAVGDPRLSADSVEGLHCMSGFEKGALTMGEDDPYNGSFRWALRSAKGAPCYSEPRRAAAQ